MVDTINRTIKDFDFDIKSYREFKHKYEPSNICEMPVKWNKARDFNVYDDKGNKWIDMTSGIFVTNAGHSNPLINEAIKNQVDSGLSFAYQYNTDIRNEFIEKLLEISPSHFNKVVLLNSGSEATDAAYRLIKLWGKKKNKKYIVVFTGNYHGRVLGSDLMGGTSTSTDWCNLKDNELWFLPFPKDGDELDLNDLPPLDETACFFLETYQGWGAWLYPQKYIDKLYKISRDNNILFCFDEVQSGFYRMGELYGYMTYGDYKPDLITLGKGLTSSLPLSAILSTEEIIDIDSSANLSSTHAGNAICCAAGLANLNFLTSDELHNDFQERVELFERLNKELEQEEGVEVVNVKGMVSAIIVKDGDMGNYVTENCIKNGVLTVWTKRESIKLGPPLTISKSAIVESMGVIRDFIRSYNE
jgi:acetylornithine/succinyldiaminopimelate/putrescine aminotransferase|tara:strand:+ start:5786 stop:7033 length:1248 start_codon:yes stop_codon:yes gene_type:complete